MKTINQRDAQSVLFVVLGEGQFDLQLARSILPDTEICASIYTEIDTGELTMTTALNQHLSCRMVVIAVPESGNMLKTALAWSKVSKERGILTVVATPCAGRTPTEYLADESLTEEQLMSYADCVLFAPIWRDNMSNAREKFWHDMQHFQQYLTSLLDGNDFIYLDFNDISAILKNSGFAYLGVASITAADTATRKAHIASVEPLPKEILAKAKGLIMHIVGSNDIGLDDIDAAADAIQRHTNPNGVLIFGAGFDSEFHQEMQVSVLAAGISN